jgi:PBSX family phage terminase large subunit
MFDFKPFSRKQLDVICNADAFINILEGSVRSGKTIASIVAWIYFLKTSPHRTFLMTGSTSDTLYRNVIEDIIHILGNKRSRYVKSATGGSKLTIKVDNPDYPKRSKQRYIYKHCYCVGAHDERAEGRIRGMTIGGWYADEVTLYPESVVKQAINRMSLIGARAIWTTNPDSPYHYIKTEFIEKAEEKGYKSWHFELDDNLALDEQYKKNIKNAYVGLWYLRMILGLWVLAEGAIYDMFDEKVHVIHCPADGYQEYGVSIDYGTATVMTFGLYGVNYKEDKPVVHLIREYYYNAKKTSRQKTDGQFADDFEKFLAGVVPRDIFVDPSAASFKEELRKRGYRQVKDADNDVINGIRFVAGLLSSKRFFIDDSCTDSKREFNAYVWDEKAQKRGEDKPKKENDHTKDRDRYFIYTRFGIQIKSVGTSLMADLSSFYE